MSFSTLLRFSQYQLIARVPWMLLCKHNNRQRFWSTFKTKCCISSSLIERESERERQREREEFFFLFCCKIPKKKAGKQTKNCEISLWEKKIQNLQFKKKILFPYLYWVSYIIYTNTYLHVTEKNIISSIKWKCIALILNRQWIILFSISNSLCFSCILKTRLWR